MRLEPVYLAPRPKPPSMPTRRAFLLTGAAFLGGAAIGGACGYTAGVARGGKGERVVPKEPDEIVLEPSGNAELDELHRWAVKLPIGELMEKAPMFLTQQLNNYRDDAILWHGVVRLSREILDNPKHGADQMLIGILIENIQYLTPPPELGLRKLLPALQQRRGEARKRK